MAVLVERSADRKEFAHQQADRGREVPLFTCQRTLNENYRLG